MKLHLLLTLLATATVAQSAEARHPNILYVLPDQWRAQATGYAGDPNVRTPNLDRLAKEGIYFRNAVSVCPVCTPHRAALMTGRYPTSTGMFLNDQGCAAIPPRPRQERPSVRAAGRLRRTAFPA
jgi:arylsulfatase A-like enzyme